MAPRTPIYLDHHATTPVDPRVLEAMLPYLGDDFGNPASSSHVFGWRAEAAVEESLERIATALGVLPEEIVFTSGATESNNLAILGVSRAMRTRGDHVVTTAIEHPSVLDPIRQLEREGFRCSVVDVDTEGNVDPERIEAELTDQTVLVSVAAANGEIGTLQFMPEIARICAQRRVWFHTDAAQAVGKVDLAFRDPGPDLASISGHKIYGPKGIGALVVRKRAPRIPIQPLFFGGGHQRGLRSGTLPVHLIVGLATALELCVEQREPESKRLSALRDRLAKKIEVAWPACRINGSIENRLPGNLNVWLPGIDAERLLLELPDVAISTGSACSSALPEPSPVLLALGRSEAEAKQSLRFGLGRGTTESEVDEAAMRIAAAIARVDAQTP